MSELIAKTTRDVEHIRCSDNRYRSNGACVYIPIVALQHGDVNVQTLPPPRAPRPAEAVDPTK